MKERKPTASVGRPMGGRKKQMKLLKKALALCLVLCMGTLALASCIETGTEIHLITREESSGTRSAFTELLGILDEDGNDAIVATAEITNSTNVMITSVAGDRNAIGYISLGALSADVKALRIDGVTPTVENIKNNTYKLARPFNLAYVDGTLSDVARDFLAFVMSSEGQALIAAEGYIATDGAPSYTPSGKSGRVTLAGSTSIAPVMGKLKDAYESLNSNVAVEVNEGGSSAGMTAAINGTCDIGMASRELKESEKTKLASVRMASDGIAVIVHLENSVVDMTSEEVRRIYMGELTNWVVD